MTWEEKVYIAVFSSQERNFDECEYSRLPLFHTIFGVYESMDDALGDVYDYFYNMYGDQYEETDHTPFRDEQGVVFGHEFTFKYTDRKFGGYALYTLQVEAAEVYPKGFSNYRKKEERS